MDFPGGKRQVHETAWACGLREAAEELYTEIPRLLDLCVQPVFMVNCGRGGVLHFLPGMHVPTLEATAPCLGAMSQWGSKVHLVASVGPRPRGAATGGAGDEAAETGDVASMGDMLHCMGL